MKSRRGQGRQIKRLRRGLNRWRTSRFAGVSRVWRRRPAAARIDEIVGIADRMEESISV